MAWGMIAAPGTEAGPCKESCKHLDCSASKMEASKICPGCDKPIGYETPFCTVRDKADLPWAWHRLCAEIDAEKAPVGIHAPTTRTHVRTKPLSASRRTKPLK